MRSLSRIWAWSRFNLAEYIRSGRILIELLAMVIFAYIFLRRPNTAAIIRATQFFSMTALFVLAQTIYTTGMLVSLAQRAQGYVILARPLGRRGYLLGLFLVPVIIGVLDFILLSIIVTIINKPEIWTVPIWLAGALPLILDIMLVTALVILLSGLVLTNGWRLFILGLVALGSLSSADLIGPSLSLDNLIGRFLATMRTLVSVPLIPLLSGFELAVRRGYGSEALPILLGQIVLTAAVLFFAIFSFDRRDIILG